ncbi:MAG: AAA family ATPase [Planctomycetota bacterium]
MPISLPVADAPATPNETEAPSHVCSAPNCSNGNIHAKGRCLKHYNAIRQAKRQLQGIDAPGCTCRKEGCEQQSFAQGLCEDCYLIWFDSPPKPQRRKRSEATETPPTLAPQPRQQPKPVDVSESDHPALAEVLELIESGENVMLVGPAGTGKSYLAESVAKKLGRRFGSISCSAGMSESHLVGRMLPIGDSGAFEFVSTEFLECYETGGVFLLDEMDSADPNVLLVINSALANGYLSVPARHGNPRAKRHPDFALIAACNTFGRGADRQYVGRSQLDESTLDRFRIGTVAVDYCQTLERRLFTGIAGECDDAIELLSAIWGYRSAVFSNRLERCVSTRFVISAAKAFARGRDLDYVRGKLFSGWRADEIRKAKGA